MVVVVVTGKSKSKKARGGKRFGNPLRRFMH